MNKLFQKVRSQLDLKKSPTSGQTKAMLEAIDRFEHLTVAIMKRLSPEEHKLALKDYEAIQKIAEKK